MFVVILLLMRNENLAVADRDQQNRLLLSDGSSSPFTDTCDFSALLVSYICTYCIHMYDIPL